MCRCLSLSLPISWISRLLKTTLDGNRWTVEEDGPNYIILQVNNVGLLNNISVVITYDPTLAGGVGFFVGQNRDGVSRNPYRPRY